MTSDVLLPQRRARQRVADVERQILVAIRPVRRVDGIIDVTHDVREKGLSGVEPNFDFCHTKPKANAVWVEAWVT